MPLASKNLRKSPVKRLMLLSCVFLDPVRFDALGADLDALDALGCFYAHLLEIRQPGLLGFVLGMGNLVPCERALTTYITSS